jgi:hypothetical protein
VVKKAKTGKHAYPSDELWIAMSHSLKWPPPKIGWELRPSDSVGSNRFLELADVALGHKTSRTHKKRNLHKIRERK